MEVYYELLDKENGYLRLRPNRSTFFFLKKICSLVTLAAVGSYYNLAWWGN